MATYLEQRTEFAPPKMIAQKASASTMIHVSRVGVSAAEKYE
jgi:hypothetical protein